MLRFMEKKCSDGYADFGNGEILYDKDVADFVKKHLRVVDRFNVRKVCEATLQAFAMLQSHEEIPKGNWKF